MNKQGPKAHRSLAATVVREICSLRAKADLSRLGIDPKNCKDTSLLLMMIGLLASPAQGQIYCSRFAELVDSPANVRLLPTVESEIVCQLKPLGMRFRVYPVLSPALPGEHGWLATFACHRSSMQSQPVLGAAPNFIHRSQFKIVGIDPADWTSVETAIPGRLSMRSCEDLWRAYPN